MSNKDLEHAIRTLNGLDSYDYKEYVEFYANLENKKYNRPTVTLLIKDGFIQVVQSSTLPTNNWAEHAAAYHRADVFLRLSRLSDSRPEQPT